MNLTNRPIPKKTGKPKRNRAHMAKVAKLPCVICGRRPVQVHHVICGRYSQRRASDRETIPLCPECHADLHANKTAWRDRNGADHEYLAVVADMLAGELNP